MSVHNSVTFSRKSMEYEEFLNQMVVSLDITIDRSSEGRLRKLES